MDTVAEVSDIQAPAGTMATFGYRPADDQRHPAVIVLPEVFGVDDHIKDVTRRFAAEGYFAIAPDPFYRAGRNLTLPYDTDHPSTAPLRVGMTHDTTVEDLKAVMAFLKSHPHADEQHVGIIGYCWGGRVGFLAACSVPGIGACVNLYGGGIMPRESSPYSDPPVIDRAEGIACPILGFFGGKDQLIPLDEVRRWEETLKGLGKDVEVHIYPDAGHGFFCDDTERGVYNEAAAKDSWERTLRLFQRHLKGAEVRTA